MEAMGHPVPQSQLDAIAEACRQHLVLRMQIRQQFVAVHGPASGGQPGRSANTADSADTELIGLDP